MKNQSNAWQWLDAAHCKRTITRAGMFLLAYEMLKSAIVDDVRDFYLSGFADGELTYSPEYEKRVLSKSKHLFEAALLWLVEVGAITPEDITDIQKLREYRNAIAHEVPKVLFETPDGVDDAMIRRAIEHVRKIDRFWGGIAADTDPQFDGVEIDYEGITSLRTMALDYIAQVVSESEEEAESGNQAKQQ